MESIKLQLGSLTILVFITIVYVFRLIHYKRKVNFNFFLIFINIHLHRGDENR